VLSLNEREDGTGSSQGVRSVAETPPQLSLVVEQHDDRTIVRLSGELDLVTAPGFADALRSANSEIVIDCSDLRFLDASGLGVLAQASERAERDGHSLMVVNARPLAQRVFEVTGLGHLLAGTDAP
jgi:anti-sigma B factor antagonist